MKGLQVTKKVRRYKTVPGYEKDTKLRKKYEVRERYEVTNMVRSYEKGMKLQKGTKLRKRYEDVTKEVTKGLGYAFTKLRDSNATYRDNLL
jgi:hypothetical protein